MAILVSVLLVSILGVFGYMLVKIAQPPAPPIAYSADEYPPEKSVLAPGELLVYTPTLVLRTAGRITLLRSYWDYTTDGDAVLCSGGPAPVIKIERNRPKGIIGNLRGGRVVKVLTPDLPPGKYGLLTSTSGPDGGQSQTEARFTVVQKCTQR